MIQYLQTNSECYIAITQYVNSFDLVTKLQLYSFGKMNNTVQFK